MTPDKIGYPKLTTFLYWIKFKPSSDGIGDMVFTPPMSGALTRRHRVLK
jgi:hypothetical protein